METPEAPEHWPALSDFNQRLSAILSQPVQMGDDGALEPSVLTFTGEAKAAWVAFHDRVEVEIREGGAFMDVRDVASKIADNASRLAALLHVFEGNPGSLVGLESFEAAAQIAEWHLGEARRVFGELAMPVDLANAASLESWLPETCKKKGARIALARTRVLKLAFFPCGDDWDRRLADLLM